MVETRADDAATREAAGRDRRPARRRVAWRPSARSRAALGATCNTPLGAHAVLADDGALTLRAFLGLPDGSAWVRDELTDPLGASPEQLGAEVAERMRAAGADELLRVRALGRRAPPARRRGDASVSDRASSTSSAPGPGDPGLLTARALELIATADVILYDRLIPVDRARRRAGRRRADLRRQGGRRRRRCRRRRSTALLVEHGARRASASCG